MLRAGSMLAFVTLAACGASHPSAAPSASSFSAERAAESPTPSPTTPDAGDPEVELARGPRPFFVALCEHATNGDDAWIGQHLSAKLHGSIALPRAKSDMMLAPLGPDPDAVRRSLLAVAKGSSLCEWLTRGTMSSSHPVESFLRGIADLGYDDAYRFVIDTGGTRPQLAELAYELRKRPLPSSAKKASFTIEAGVLDSSADATTTAYLSSLVGGVQARPECLWDEAARGPSSPVLMIEATKTDGTSASVHLYPTNEPASASLVACLETQLTVAANEKLKAPRYAIEGVLHVSLDPKTMPAKSFSFSGTKP